MKILITGIPGAGKTTIAKRLCKCLKYAYLNESEFSLKHGIGSLNSAKELELPLPQLKKNLSSYLKDKDNIVLEGHVLCEIKLPIDIVFILIVNPLILEKRLNTRKYRAEKLLDNLFCAGTKYCEKCIYKKYDKKIVFEIINEKGLKRVVNNIINIIKEFQDKRGKNERN